MSQEEIAEGIADGMADTVAVLAGIKDELKEIKKLLGGKSKKTAPVEEAEETEEESPKKSKETKAPVFGEGEIVNVLFDDGKWSEGEVRSSRKKSGEYDVAFLNKKEEEVYSISEDYMAADGDDDRKEALEAAAESKGGNEDEEDVEEDEQEEEDDDEEAEVKKSKVKSPKGLKTSPKKKTDDDKKKAANRAKLLRGIPYKKEKLEEMKRQELVALAAALKANGVPIKNVLGKGGVLINSILTGQKKYKKK